MKLKTEISAEFAGCEEIIIRCAERGDRVRMIENVIENLIRGDSEIVLYIRDTEYYIQKRDILYFETDDGKVTAHTSERIFTCDYRLIELEHIMPPNFVRVSKSCILNALAIEAINRNPLGASEVFFQGCKKRVYVSRAYFKILRDKINELRFT